MLSIWQHSLAPSGRPVILWQQGRDAHAFADADEVVADFLHYFNKTDVMLEYYVPKGEGFARSRIDATGQREGPEFRSGPPSLWQEYCQYDALLLPKEANFRGRTLIFPHLEYADHWLNLVWPHLLRRLTSATIDWAETTAATIRENVVNWGNSRVAVVGSGPSAKEFLLLRDRINPTHVIFMNTVVCDGSFVSGAKGAKLWLCALDPALFGRSQFGVEFGRRITTVLGGTNCRLVTAEHLDRHIELNYPSIASGHCVTLRCVQAATEHADYTVDLLRKRTVLDTGNVLTTLALPLAATLGKDVFLFGCDGFNKKEGSAIMAHDPRFESEALKTYSRSKVIASVVQELSYMQSANRLEQSTAAIVKALRKRGNTLALASPSANEGFCGVPYIN